MTTYTLAYIKSRCTECGDCLLWQGSKSHATGHPKLADAPARRVVWKLHHGMEIPLGKLVTVTCGKVDCLEPTHLALTTKSAVSKITNARCDVKLRRSASTAKTNRPMLGKITMEIARQIRASDEPGRTIASTLNVSASLVSKVRCNKSWVEHTNNVWAGLTA